MTKKTRVIDDKEMAQVEAMAGTGVTNEMIADYMGVSRTTWFDIKARQPEVMDAYMRGKAKTGAKVGQTIVKAALEGNMTAAIFYAKTQMHWREKSEIDVTSSDGSLTPTVIERTVIYPEDR